MQIKISSGIIVRTVQTKTLNKITQRMIQTKKVILDITYDKATTAIVFYAM